MLSTQFTLNCLVEKEEEGCGGGDIDSGNSTSHSPEEWPGIYRQIDR